MILFIFKRSLMEIIKSIFGSIEVVKSGDKMMLTGYASIFGNVDSHGEIVDKDAFSEIPALEDLHFLQEHDWSKPIGFLRVVKSDSRGLYYEAEVHHTEEKVFKKIESGLIKGSSFRARVEDYKHVEISDRYVKKLTKLGLRELSVVTSGANPLAFSAVKSLTRDEFYKFAASLKAEDKKDLMKMLTIDPVDDFELEGLTKLVNRYNDILKGE